MTPSTPADLARALDALSNDDYAAVLDALTVLLPWTQVEADTYELRTRGGRTVATVWKGKDGWHVTGKVDNAASFLGWAASAREARRNAEAELRNRGYTLPERPRPDLHVVGGAFGHAPVPAFKEV